MQFRENALKEWLKININLPEYTLSPLNGDASFRRYFRLNSNQSSYIIMDAPPEQESIKEFLLISNFLINNELHAPKIFASDLQHGFIILEDFGDQQFLMAIQDQNQKLNFYKTAIDILLKMQLTSPSALNLPAMDREFYWRELTLFKVWFLNGYLKIDMNLDEVAIVDDAFNKLIDELATIPTSLVHRDFHSRNLMILNDHKLGILDFQDAVIGPITYDLASLLRDCYTKLSNDDLHWCLDYFYQNSPIKQYLDFSNYKRAFDLTGLQRHLKVLGIFCRLYLRDGKANYLHDLPLTLAYVKEGLLQYPEYQEFANLINRVQLPCL
jgi:aminoglycoside/choline kinase family phosphotransferase